jgi:hypothetical protein
MDRFLDMDVAGLIARVKPVTEKHMRLTDAIGSLLQDFNMVCSTSPPAKRARVRTLCHLDVPPTCAYALLRAVWLQASARRLLLDLLIYASTLFVACVRC